MSQPSFEPEPGAMDSETVDPTAMSGVAPAPQYRKQGFSIYSVMLIGSFVFLLSAMIFLFIEAGRY